MPHRLPATKHHRSPNRLEMSRRSCRHQPHRLQCSHCSDVGGWVDTVPTLHCNSDARGQTDPDTCKRPTFGARRLGDVRLEGLCRRSKEEWAVYVTGESNNSAVRFGYCNGTFVVGLFKT